MRFHSTPELSHTDCLNVVVSTTLCNKLTSPDTFSPRMHLRFIFWLVGLYLSKSWNRLHGQGMFSFPKQRSRDPWTSKDACAPRDRGWKHWGFWENPMYKVPCPAWVPARQCNPQGSAENAAFPGQRRHHGSLPSSHEIQPKPGLGLSVLSCLFCHLGI